MNKLKKVNDLVLTWTVTCDEQFLFPFGQCISINFTLKILKAFITIDWCKIQCASFAFHSALKLQK